MMKVKKQPEQALYSNALQILVTNLQHWLPTDIIFCPLSQPSVAASKMVRFLNLDFGLPSVYLLKQIDFLNPKQKLFINMHKILQEHV